VISDLYVNLKGSDQSNKRILLGQLYGKLNLAQQYVFIDKILSQIELFLNFLQQLFSVAPRFKSRIFFKWEEI